MSSTSVTAALSTRIRFGIEVVSSVGDELTVARVIDRLDADDLGFEPVVMFGQKPQKLQLGGRWSNEQDLISVAQHGSDVPKKLSAIAGVLMLGGGTFRVAMQMVLRRRDRLGLKFFCVDAEDARLLMVEPHDGLMSLHGQPLSKLCANGQGPVLPAKSRRGSLELGAGGAEIAPSSAICAQIQPRRTKSAFTSCVKTM